MRVTVCELPHDPMALAGAWAGLRRHAIQRRSDLVLLPEFAWVPPLWETETFDEDRWVAAEALTEHWLKRLPELETEFVVGTRPARIDGRPFNQGYLWSAATGVVPLRSKFFMPESPGGWESHWFDRGDPGFPTFRAGALSFGLNICTELWALETYPAYAARDIQMILSPRATAAATTTKWLSLGLVAAVRTGAFSVSSNRVDPTGAYGGVGWIIGPDGELLATTSAAAPYATEEIDLAASAAAREGYPRSVFTAEGKAAR